jgi:hypothetical protein
MIFSLFSLPLTSSTIGMRKERFGEIKLLAKVSLMETLEDMALDHLGALISDLMLFPQDQWLSSLVTR